jgi:hypothetical protein
MSPDFRGNNEERNKKYTKIADDPAEIRTMSPEHKSAALSPRQFFLPLVHYFLGYAVNTSHSLQQQHIHFVHRAANSFNIPHLVSVQTFQPPCTVCRVEHLLPDEQSSSLQTRNLINKISSLFCCSVQSVPEVTLH